MRRTAPEILLDPSREHRYRRVEAHRLLDAHLEVLQPLEVVGSARTVRFA